MVYVKVMLASAFGDDAPNKEEDSDALSEKKIVVIFLPDRMLN